MKKTNLLLFMVLLSGCSTYPVTSEVFLASPPPLTADLAKEKADDAIRREQWEEANLYLLTALDIEPSLSQQADFMQKLAETSKRLGIDDFTWGNDPLQ